MNIEIADRLVKLRKQKGLSQEELADKLGLSRQAVSKWERAEASPDTDNLICLAKLYGVSLDQLLNTDDDLNTIINEQVKKDDVTPEVEEAKEEKESTTINKDNKETVHIDKDGIHIESEDQTVHIDKDGIYVNGQDIKEKVKTQVKQEIVTEKKISKPVYEGIIESSLFFLSLIAYIVLGFILGGKAWSTYWILIFVPDIIVSIVRSIRKSKFTCFNITFLVLFVFFFVSYLLPTFITSMPYLWHPMWVVFLVIPLYYITFGGVDKAIATKKILNK